MVLVTMNDTPSQPLQTPTPITPNPMIMNSTPVPSDYEKCREERIKENLERMQKLGIYDLSLKFRSVKPNSYRKNNSKTPNRCIPPLPSSVPTRRSSRLQSTPAVSYTEVVLSKKGEDGDDMLMAKNTNPEVYTEEHEKLLGETKTEWTLFVDGYGKDGKRIYDPVRGKTCHQCRQKTLGHRTHCIKCNMVQGQFCGDCLYMRYGENVLEAKQNPDWICPVCRGICNCSLCRQAKGWAPTGVLYRKISSQGYKSVAHYLIQTYRADLNVEKNEKTDTQVCAKRSCTFSREEAESKDIAAKNENIESEHKIPESEVNTDDKTLCNNVKLESDQGSGEHDPSAELREGENVNRNKVNESEEAASEDFAAQNEYTESKHKNPESEVNTDDKPLCNNIKQDSDKGPGELDPSAELSEGETENMNKVNLKLTNVEYKVNNTDDEVKTVVLTPETKPGSRKKRATVVLEDSIARRLRSRRH